MAIKVLELCGVDSGRAKGMINMASNLPGSTYIEDGISVCCDMPFCGEMSPCRECGLFTPLEDDPFWGWCEYHSKAKAGEIIINALVNISTIPGNCHGYNPKHQ